MLAMPVAMAQELPSGGNVVLPAGGAVVVDRASPPVTMINPAAGAVALDVGLIAPATVINWTTFNIVDATVNFRQAGSGAGAVVVNRVTGGAGSTLNNGQLTTYATLGDATTRQNTSVWLLNPAGVLIGGTSAIDVGGFLGSTLDICAAANCADALGVGNLAALGAGGPVHLVADAASTSRFAMTTGRISSGGALVVVAGAIDIAPGTTLGAGGEVNLVAATDVRVSSPGSPLVYQIDRGSQVAGTLVSAGGEIGGSAVVIAAARPDGINDALLGLAGTITATGVGAGARGVVLLGGTGLSDPATAIAGDPAPPAPATILTIAAGNSGSGSIANGAAIASSRDVIVNGTGAVTVASAVNAAGQYRVSGASVTLGDAAAAGVVQQAGGAVTVRATTGDIAGLGVLTLQSNVDGSGSEALTLASQRAIGFGADTRLLGGDGTAGGNADVRVVENAASTATSFGEIRARSLGGIPADATATPTALTLYGPTTLGDLTLDRSLDLTIAGGGGGAPGSLTAGVIAVGAQPLDTGGGVALADNVIITTARDARFDAVASATGSVAITARDGNVSATTVSSARSTVVRGSSPAIADGNVAIYAGRTDAGVLTATGTNGQAMLGTVTAGNDVTVLAQAIDAGSVYAAAVSTAPPVVAGASGTARLQAYAGDLTVGPVSAGTGVASRAGLDVLLTADAPGALVRATTFNADRNVSIVANAIATIAGEVRAGRVDRIGGYSVTAGLVTLGTTGAAIQQSATGGVTIVSTQTDILGLGGLMLQSNSDGIAAAAPAQPETLILDARRAIDFSATSRVFGGDGTAAGSSDILVRAGETATATNFGDIRGRSLGGMVADGSTPATVTLYGQTRIGRVDVDRSLRLTVANGGGAEPGTLTAGPITVGVHPTDDGGGAAGVDNLAITTASSARLLSAASSTGSVAITAVDGDVTGLAVVAGGFGRIAVTAARADAAATPRIADGTIDILAGRTAAGELTATGANGLALFDALIAGGDVRVTAQAIDGVLAQSDRGNAALGAYAANGAQESFILGTGRSGLGTTLDAFGGSVRVGTVEAGLTAIAGATTGLVRIDSYGDARIGVATPTVAVPGGVVTQLGNIEVTSHHGDITGAGTESAAGRADLSAIDGNINVTADAQALTAVQVGRVQLGTIFAQTKEPLTGTTTAPARGNIDVTGRVVDVTRAEAARFAGGVTVANSGGGRLALTAREGTPADDVHLLLGTGLAGTDATLTAAHGSAVGPTGLNGSVVVGALDAGRNRVVGTSVALAGDVTILATNDVRADAVMSRTGNVAISAINGDVTGGLVDVVSVRATVTAARAGAAAGDDLAITDGSVTISALSMTPARGLAKLGDVAAGGEIRVDARAIDAVGQRAQSDAGSVIYNAWSGNLTLGRATAGVDVLLTALADTQLLTRGPGEVTVDFITAGRHAEVAAARDARITHDASAGIGGSLGHYHVTAGRDVVLGDDGVTAAAGEDDLHSALDDVRIVAAGGVIGNRLLTLRSNSLGQTDPGDTRSLTIDAGGAVSFALPDGLTATARDVLTSRLIGGSDNAPQQSIVQVRAGAGTEMRVGNVTARALRSFGTIPVGADFPEFAALAGTAPLHHAGDVRIGTVDVDETLGIFAYTDPTAPDRLLQIDTAISRRGNIALVGGTIRGYQLAPADGQIPLGRYVATDLEARNARIDTYSESALLGDVVALGPIDLETFGGRLRVNTVEALPTLLAGAPESPAIRLSAATDLRLTSAVAASGDIVALANAGDVTGLPTPDDGSAVIGHARVALIRALDGSATVQALATSATNGVADITTIEAFSTETPGSITPERGNVAVTGSALDIVAATAGAGSLTLTAGLTLALGTGSAGTAATATVSEGSAVIDVLDAGTNVRSGNGTATAGDVAVTVAANAQLGRVTSGTGSVTITAIDGNVSATTLHAARGTVAQGGALGILDGDVKVHAGRTDTGVLTATGINGLATLGIVTAGNDATVLAQTINVGSIEAAAVSTAPMVTGAASGSATLHAFAGDLTVVAASAGTGNASRAGLDVLLTAGAPGAKVAATTLNADRNVTVFADGNAGIPGEVRAGRVDPAGAYSVTGGRVMLGTSGAAVEQSTSGAVLIRSTVSEIMGLGTLTLQSNSDGIASGTPLVSETLTVDAAGAIDFSAQSQILGGDGTAAGGADIMVREGSIAAATSFGQIRGRSLGGVPAENGAPTALTLYGPTTLGGVDVDRTLDITVADGGGTQSGTLNSGPITVGVNASQGVTDNLSVTTTGTARYAAVTSNTGGVALLTTGAGQSIIASDAIVARDAVTVRAAQDVATTTTVASRLGDVEIAAGAGDATGGTVNAFTDPPAATTLPGGVTIGAGQLARYDAIGSSASFVSVDAGTIAIGMASAGTAIDLRAGGPDGSALASEALVLGSGIAGTTATLRSVAGGVRAGVITAGATRNDTPGDVTITAARDVRLGDVQSTTGSIAVTAIDGDVTGLAGTVQGSRANLAAATATVAQVGQAAIRDGQVTILARRSATAETGTRAEAGVVQLGTVTAGDSVTVMAQAIDAITVQAGLVSNAPPTPGEASGDVVLTAWAGDLKVGSATAGTAGTSRAARDVLLDAKAGAATANTLVADRNVGVTASGAVTIDGAVDAGRRDPSGAYTVRGVSVVLGAGGASVLQNAAAATTITATAGNVTGLGALTLQSNRDGGGAEPLKVTANSGNVIFDTASTLAGGMGGANGSNIVVAATPGSVSGGVVTLGIVTASGKSAIVRGRDVTLQSAVTAQSVGLFNQATASATNATLLGSAPGEGFALSGDELGRIDAATVTIGSGTDDNSTGELAIAGGSVGLHQDTTIGALVLGAATGSTVFRVLGTGTNTISVNGALDARTSPATRTIQLGGGANAAGEVARIAVINGGGSTASGIVDAGAGTLDLRGGSILAGQNSFIDKVRASANIGSEFIANPNSSLYGVEGYLTPVTLVKAGQLKLQFSGTALFQNTGRAGLTTLGVEITGPPSTAAEGQPLVLRSGSQTQASGFALFGTITGFQGVEAALLGSSYISNNAAATGSVNPSNARINGCLIGSASGGCLASSIAQPSLNVLDVTRDQVLRGSEQLVVNFDPLVGSNNEALFGDVAAGDYQFDAVTCPDGTVSAQCETTPGESR